MSDDIEVTILVSADEARTLRRWEPDLTAHRYVDGFIGTILAKRIAEKLPRPRPIKVGDRVRWEPYGDDVFVVKAIDGDGVWVAYATDGHDTASLDYLHVTTDGDA